MKDFKKLKEEDTNLRFIMKALASIVFLAFWSHAICSGSVSGSP